MHGAVKRIRPKVMTVAAMFVGLVPIMWSTGAGADVMKRIAAPDDRRDLHVVPSGAGGLSGNLRGLEMAIGKAAICLILGCAAWAQQFSVRHEHLRKFCVGTLTVDPKGIRFEGPKHHAWNWPYAEIQQLTLRSGSIHILSYKDSSNWKLGKDVSYTFTGEFPTEDLERQWTAQLDQRFVAARRTGIRPVQSRISGKAIRTDQRYRRHTDLRRDCRGVRYGTRRSHLAL